MSKSLFECVVRELEEKLGLTFTLADDELLQFQFDDGISASISYEEATESVIVEVRFSARMPEDATVRARFMRLMLQLNYQWQRSHGIALALDVSGHFTVVGSRAVRILDAEKLIDLLEFAIDQGREIAGSAHTLTNETEAHSLETAPSFFLRV